MSFEYENRRVQVYTDGCCLNNGQYGATAGVGVFFADNHHLNVSRPLMGAPHTNNNAEIQAARIAIQQARSAGVTHLQVNTDSDFLVKSVTQYMSRWKMNGWRGANNSPVKNRQEFEHLDDAMHGINVTWCHVPGHAGVYGNERANDLAVQGARSRCRW